MHPTSAPTKIRDEPQLLYQALSKDSFKPTQVSHGGTKAQSSKRATCSGLVSLSQATSVPLCLWLPGYWLI